MADDQGLSVEVLAKMVGLTPRRVQQLVKEGMPTLGRGRYPVSSIKWYIDYLADRAKKYGAESDPNSFAAARVKKVRAEARLVEIDLQKAEGHLIPIELYEKELNAFCARLKAAVMTVPAKYLGRIQVARTEIEAQQVGEFIRDELLAALRERGDDEEVIEHEVDAA